MISALQVPIQGTDILNQASITSEIQSGSLAIPQQIQALLDPLHVCSQPRQPNEHVKPHLPHDSPTILATTKLWIPPALQPSLPSYSSYQSILASSQALPAPVPPARSPPAAWPAAGSLCQGEWRRGHAIVAAVAAEVAAAGGRERAQAILAATLGPDGRLRLPPPAG